MRRHSPVDEEARAKDTHRTSSTRAVTSRSLRRTTRRTVRQPKVATSAGSTEPDGEALLRRRETARDRQVHRQRRSKSEFGWHVIKLEGSARRLRRRSTRSRASSARWSSRSSSRPTSGPWLKTAKVERSALSYLRAGSTLSRSGSSG